MSVRKHRAIRLPAHPPRKILPIVKELVKVLNQQQTDVRSFAASQKISFSKVYNWIAGKATPKRNSCDVILRYFRKLGYQYEPFPQKQRSAKARAGKLSNRTNSFLTREVREIKMELEQQAAQIKLLRTLVQDMTANARVIRRGRKRKKEM